MGKGEEKKKVADVAGGLVSKKWGLFKWDVIFCVSCPTIKKGRPTFFGGFQGRNERGF